MTLEEYRNSKNLTYRQLAEGIGVSAAVVAKRYCDHDQIPRREIMDNIFAFTDGAVTPNDFYGLGEPSPEAAAE